MLILAIQQSCIPTVCKTNSQPCIQCMYSFMRTLQQWLINTVDTFLIPFNKKSLKKLAKLLWKERHNDRRDENFFKMLKNVPYARSLCLLFAGKNTSLQWLKNTKRPLHWLILKTTRKAEWRSCVKECVMQCFWTN